MTMLMEDITTWWPPHNMVCSPTEVVGVISRGGFSLIQLNRIYTNESCM